MDGESQRAGLIASGAMHLALLAALVAGFTRPPRFDDAPESIPVETITTTELNEIMKGEKQAKPAAKPAPPPAERPVPEPPRPPKPEPPEPPKSEPPPPEPPKRPDPPPPQPEPPKPEPPKPEPPAPEPPRRPEPPKPLAQDAPSPPVKPRVAKLEEPPRPPKAEEAPKPPERTRSLRLDEPKEPRTEKFSPDEIAKALAKEKTEEKPRPKPPAFDPKAIDKLIGQTKTAEIKPNAAPQGLPNRSAPRMSVSLENALNDWLKDSYDNCWVRPPSKPADQDYEFRVRVVFNADGSLAAAPELLNPPQDPDWRAYSESVMRAVKRCNPLKVPAQFAPYYEQWRSKSIHFDSKDKEG